MRVGRGWIVLALLTVVVGILTGVGVRPALAQQSAARPPFRYGIVVSNSSNYPEAAKLGFGWIKLFVSWNLAEPSKGTFNYYVDNAVTQARANNLRVVALIYDPPAWANGTGSYNPTNPPPSVDHVADLGTLAGNLAAHYRGQIDAYEIWNEENVSDTWGGQNPDPDRYVRMLQAAYPQIKAADPNALVISGGVANTGAGNGGSVLGDLIYLQDILQLGAASYVDAIGIHPYPGACDPTATSCAATPGTYFQRAVDEHNTVVQSGGGSLPLWITEAGYFSQPGAIDPAAAGCNGSNGLGGFTAYEVDETTKANDLVAAFQYAYTNWPWLGMFMMMNLDLSSGNYATCDPVRFWSILTSGGGETQAYAALKNMTKFAPLISFGSGYTQSAGQATITGQVTDPTTSGSPGVDAVIASVDAPYTPTSLFASTTFSPGGSFQISADLTHLTYNVVHLIYVYVHTPTQGWTVGSTGVTPAPYVAITPGSLYVWLDPSQSTSATTTFTLTRNDQPGGVVNWNTTVAPAASWLTITPRSNSGSTMTLQATIDAAGLAPGAHATTITLNTGDPTAASWFKNWPLTVPVTVMVGPRHTVFVPALPALGLPEGL